MINKSFIEVLDRECTIYENTINTGCKGIGLEEATGLIQYFMEMKMPFKVCPHIEDTVSIELLN